MGIGINAGDSLMHNLLNWHWDALAMGRYGLYVWPAYGLVVFIFMLHIVGFKWHHQKIRRALQRWFKR